MIIRPWYKLIALSSVLATAGTAYAADKPSDKADTIFAQMDTNKDGVITYDEMMANVKVKFGEFDKNKDGFLVLDELPREMPMPPRMKHDMKRYEKWAKRHNRDGEGMGPGGPRADGKGPEAMGPRKAPTRMQFMARFDRDGDERVSVEEFAEPAIRHFKHADLNGDGKVTKQEAQEARKQRFREMRDHRPMRPFGRR